MSTQTVMLAASLATGIIGLAVALYSFLAVRRTQKLRENMGPDHQPENLEEILEAIVSKIKALERHTAQTDENLEITTEQTGLSLKKLGFVRFNSFADEGGNLSFCLALLDTENNGIVLTNLHGREQNRMYAKRIVKSVGEVSLNDEEQQAVMLAVTEHKNKAQSNIDNS
jgi:hypothetical protein